MAFVAIYAARLGASSFQVSLLTAGPAVVPPNAVPIVSTGSGLLYTIGARENAWTLEALDWESGASAFHWKIGGQRFNSLFAGTLLDEAGRIHYGGPWIRIRLAPQP